MASPPPHPKNQGPRPPLKRIIPKRPAPPPPTQFHRAQNPRDLGLTQPCLPASVPMTAPSLSPALNGVVPPPHHLDRPNCQLPAPPDNAIFAAQPSQTATLKTKARHGQLSKTLLPCVPSPEMGNLDKLLRVQRNPQVITEQNRCNRNNRKKKLTKEDISAPTLVSASVAIIRHGGQIRIADRDPNDGFYGARYDDVKRIWRFGVGEMAIRKHRRKLEYPRSLTQKGALFDDVKKIRRLKIANRPLPTPNAVAHTSAAVTVSSRTMSPPPLRTKHHAPICPAETVSRRILSPPPSRAQLLAPISPAVTVSRRPLPPARSRTLTLPYMCQSPPSQRLPPSPAFLDRPPKAPSSTVKNIMTKTKETVRVRIPPALPLSIEEPHSFPVSVWITRQTDRQIQQPILHPVHVNGSSTQQPHLKHTSSSGGSECLVCIEEEAEVVFLECGHMVSCAQCSQRLQTCPLCRANISRKMTVSKC